jgi:hypothetical protein
MTMIIQKLSLKNSFLSRSNDLVLSMAYEEKEKCFVKIKIAKMAN